MAEPGDWTDQALCAGLDPDLFFPGKGLHTTVMRSVKDICETCPVLNQCWEYTMSLSLWHTSHGIWAGTTPAQRRDERHAAAAELRTPSRLSALGAHHPQDGWEQTALFDVS
jgi:WhiB family transcriptional regulator, redox-sensing transcriptional regulator